MLLQSHEGFLRLLPALPRIWDRGSLVARGNFFASCWWERGILPEKEKTAGSFCRRGWRQLGPQVNGKRRSSGFRRRSERGTNLFGRGAATDLRKIRWEGAAIAGPGGLMV